MLAAPGRRRSFAPFPSAESPLRRQLSLRSRMLVCWCSRSGVHQINNLMVCSSDVPVCASKTLIWRCICKAGRKNCLVASDRATPGQHLTKSALPPTPDSSRTFADFRFVPILLQKSLAVFVNSGSLVLMRFAAEAIDDGTSQSRPGTVFLFVSS